MNFLERTLDFSTPHVMGVINATPDSFFMPSRVNTFDALFSHVEAMIAAGASIIDVGGEATNPTFDVTESNVSEDEEQSRVIPVSKAIADRFDIIISVDTSKAAVMKSAVESGATMINDQRALQLSGALATAAALKVPVCLMHMFGLNQRIPNAQPLADVLNDVLSWLRSRVKDVVGAGVLPQNIIIDPGFGHGNYGKSTTENLYLLKHLSEFVALDFPVLVGVSRKTFIGKLTGADVSDRLPGSLVLAALAALQGASIIRVHDVGQTKQAMKIITAYQNLECLSAVE